MINLITQDDLKIFIKKNPGILFINKDNEEIELNNEIINTLTLNENLICKNNNENFDFKINKYNINILDNLPKGLKEKTWTDCNFLFIEEYNFINKDKELRNEFMNYIKKILKSPYVKKKYNEIETRFDTNNYIYDSDDIINEIFQYVHFFPFPFDDLYGYADKGTMDIFITMYEDNNDKYDLLGKLYANCNDIIHEIFHNSAVYYINNSENKKFSDYNSKIPSKKKKEYIQTQKNFLDEIKSMDKRIKTEKNIDLGDSLEIELYGFCLREFNLYNTLNLFLESTWYDEEKIKIFRNNIIKGSKVNDNDNDNDNDKENEITINIKEYIESNNLLKIFFNLFNLEDNEIVTTNKIIYERKREFCNDDENKWIIFSRPLGLSRYEIHPGYGP